LCQFQDPEDLKRFIHPALLKLYKYDTDKNNDLIQTLEVYLSNNANAKKSAEELFIHYKTVQYRINRIKGIMGIEFEDKIYKLEIEMGLKIISLLDHKSIK
jgi:purine catabolism regulator